MAFLSNSYYVSTRLILPFYLPFYQYLVPNTTAPEGQNIGSKQNDKNVPSPVVTKYFQSIWISRTFLVK